MTRIEIPKGNGKTRVIWVPTATEKHIARDVLTSLESVYRPRECVHGFTFGRSPVTNALAHAGEWRFTLSMDISAFFDNVDIRKVSGVMWAVDGANNRAFVEHSPDCDLLAFPDCRAVQGLPCSPIIANMAMDDADGRILAMREQSRLGWNFVYTRYADDLTFSFNHPNVGRRLIAAIPGVLADYGFELNPSKTHWQEATCGYRKVTGVSVGKSNIHIPRSVKRKIRAAEHQAKVGMKPKTWARFEGNKYRQQDQLEGLMEWATLKRPRRRSNPTEGSLSPARGRREIPGRPLTRNTFATVQERVITA